MSDSEAKKELLLNNSDGAQQNEGESINIIPVVKAQDDEGGEESEEEEELQDPQATLREICAEERHAKELFDKYQTCNDRVNSRSQTTETCVEELFDYLHVLDHCVTKDLFSRLK